jgi:hypothetical protein
MKPTRFVLALVAALSLAAAPAPAAEAEHGTPVKPHAGFDLMKSLAGTWERKHEDGTLTTLTYTIVSSGTALLETMDWPGDKAAMITVYHPDGESLMMTHYCGANNQPRMRCAKPGKDAKSLAFEFVDGTNMPAADTGHMHRLVVTVVDADHITQEWTWKQGDKSGPELFQFERKKS